MTSSFNIVDNWLVIIIIVKIVVRILIVIWTHKITQIIVKVIWIQVAPKFFRKVAVGLVTRIVDIAPGFIEIPKEVSGQRFNIRICGCEFTIKASMKTVANTLVCFIRAVTKPAAIIWSILYSLHAAVTAIKQSTGWDCYPEGRRLTNRCTENIPNCVNGCLTLDGIAQDELMDMCQ
jgi:hypothetical protein